MSVIPVSVWYF